MSHDSKTTDEENVDALWSIANSIARFLDEDERRAWDSAYDAALSNQATEDAGGDVPSAVGEICAAHADAKLVERRKRWGGT